MITTLIAFASLAMAAIEDADPATISTPTLQVPSCSSKTSLATIHYSHSVPDKAAFPPTEVALCYTDTHIALALTARNETSFFFNASQTTNDEIWRYEVMEAFISLGSTDPSIYLEFEVSPNNITYQAMVYNPSKTREEGAAFDHFFITEPAKDGFIEVDTLTDRSQAVWISSVKIPIALWNLDAGEAKGSKWRMNFFRTVTDEGLYPDQKLGGWSVPDRASFHMTPFFGHVRFV